MSEVNSRLAAIFDDIGNYLEFKNENPFKVKAYQKAARTLEGLSFSVDSITPKELLETPGIGKAIGEKIQVFLESGQIPLHEELKAEFPPGLLELLKVPGLGAKKVGALFHDLGVQSLADLQAALDQGKIANLTGFGKKTEENLRKSIALVAVSEERIHLGKAWDIISNIQEKLMEAGYQGDLWPCGSFRRRRETVGDIDLIAVEGSLENTAVMAAFRSLVEPENVIVSGPTKTSIRWGGRTQVDLRLIAPGSVGAALQYFTGSKDHNVSLRARCERRNWKLNEYGLFDVEEHNLLDSTLAPLAQEKQIYQLLDLPYFPPELRETGLEYSNLREGDLFQLPDLVSEADIVGNLHTHSQWSDGDLTLEQVAEQAMARGYQYLAVTDHSQYLIVANGLSVERLLEQGRQIKELNARLADQGHSFRLLWGTECDILADGKMDFPDDILAQLDWVVAAVHTSMSQPAAQMTERICSALNNPYVRVLAHPTGRVLGKREGIEADWDAVFKMAAERKVLMEINGSPKRQDLSDRMVRRAASFGLRFSLATDAHKLKDFNRMQWALGVARRAGLSAGQVVNASPWSAISSPV